MIEERERMMAERSRSLENLPDRSRQTSEEPTINRVQRSDDDDDDDDEGVEDDFDPSDSSVPRVLKRRIRKKKKQTKSKDDQMNFDHLRRRLSSATMTSGDDEDDPLACSYKTVIHRSPHFYIPEPAPGSASSPVTYPVLVLPSPTVPVNLPLQHRAHTDTDLLVHSNQPTWTSPLQWCPPSPTLLYPNKPIPTHHGQQGSVRSSSADCRRTISHPIDEHQRLIPPERAW